MDKRYLILREKFSHTREKFIEKSKAVHGDKYDYSLVEYINARTPVNIVCKIHGVFPQKPDKHTHGQGCPKCSKNYKPTLEEFIEKCVVVHGNKYDYSNAEYVKKDVPLEIKCNKCGKTFHVTPHNHLIHKEGCPHCRQSKMEISIEKLLVENNIEFEKQKVFKWLVNGKSIKKLDFYLPEYKIAIECQGLQHFKPIEYFGGEQYLERQIRNDMFKKKLCLEHGINILYYSNVKTSFPYEVIADIGDLMMKLKKAATKEK